MELKELYVTASLAQLDLSDEEAETLSALVGQMVEYFSTMREIDVENLEPTTHALLKTNRVREDAVVESAAADTLVGNAPESEGRFIVIPNVL